MELWKRIKDVDFVSTKDMTRDRWLDVRRQGIGGSDAGAIMGLNKYSSSLVVYYDKKGLRQFDGNMATERGARFEPVIRKWTLETLELTGDKTAEIETAPVILFNLKYPYMIANLDGLINLKTNTVTLQGNAITGLGGHEIKTSKMGDGFSDNEIPDSYYCQVQHYMAVTGLKWFILSAYIMVRDELKHYAVMRDDDFIERLIQKEGDFWNNNVLKDKAPEPRGLDCEGEILDDLLKNRAGEITLPSEVAELVNRERELNAHIKALENDDTQLKNEIKTKLLEAAGEVDMEAGGTIKASAGDYKVSYSMSKRRTADSDALKKAGLFEKYSKESTVATLRITGKK